MKFFHIVKFFILTAILGACLPLFAQQVSVVSKNSQTIEMERYKDKSFKIADISEMTVDGTISIAITFTAPLSDGQDLDRLITVFKDSKNNYVDGLWEISKNKREAYFKYLEPNTKYMVYIDDPWAIKNILGKGLEHRSYYQTTITTRDLQPMVGFTSSSSLLPSDFTEGIPVTTLNVKSIEVDFFQIDLKSLPNALNYLFGKSSLYAYTIDDLLKRGAKLVYSGRFDLNVKNNVRDTVMLPIKNIKELRSEGIYVAVMKQTGKYYNYYLPTTIFTITDIGIIVHKNKNGYDIFTQNINGVPIPHVNIKFLDASGKVLSELQTDSNGHLNANLGSHIATSTKETTLVAQKNGKISFVYLSANALDLGEFNIAGVQNSDKTLFAFGPRDLYRPDEKVYINAILRDADGKPISDQPIKVDIIQADNKIAKTFTWRGEEGFYQYIYELPSSAPTGDWKFKFDLGDGSQRFYTFKVEDFMPEKISLEAGKNSEFLLKNSNVIFDIYGKYLYGAPASGNRLIGEIKARALRNAVASLSGFYFGSVQDSNLNRYLNYVDTVLDESGKAQIVVQNSWSDVTSPINIVFEASLMESGGRPVTRTFTQAVWPNSELPAIKPNFGTKKIYDYKSHGYKSEFSIDENSRAEFEIIFTNKDGEKLAKNNLQVSLIQERCDYYWYFSDGWNYDYHQKNIPVDNIDVSVEQGKSAVVGFDVEWGSYIVEVTDKITGAVSSVRFWAGYSWQDNSNRGVVRPEQIKLKIDKPSYKAGDIAKVGIEAGEAGNGYLTVETSDGILWWQAIHVEKNGGTFEIPVNKEWASHDIYISATIIKDGNKNLHITPKRALGLLHLPLFRDDKKVDMQLQVPAKIEPKERVKVLLKANLNQNQKGKKFTAIVSAVDSGILNITNFQTPDPFSAFFAKRLWGVDIYDIYGNLIEGNGKAATLRFGGDMALSKAGKKPLTEILLVSMQSEPVILNENGEAEVWFDIPDFNGELRFMTQIWSDEDYGSSEQKAIVASPVVIDLNHPRFLAGGDESTLALDINNLSGFEQKLKVNVDVLGYLDGSIEQNIVIQDGTKHVVYIPITARSGFGTGTVNVKVSGITNDGKSQKTVEKKWTIGVRPSYPASTFNFFKELNKDALIQSSEFEDGYKNLDERTVEAKITLSSLPPINFAQAIQELFAYPYGCLEQTTSGIYPSIYTSSEQLQALGIKTSGDEERKKNVEKGIERLLGMQKPNGSFGFWSSDSTEAHWATVYVTDFLLRAKEQGYYIPQEALKNAIERLQYYINTGSIDYGYSYSSSYTNFAVKSYAALVLAREQKANIGNLRRLYELANDNQSSLALTQLGIALKLMGDNERANDLLKKALLFSSNRDWHWYGDYGSNVRDKALILSLLYEHDLLQNERAKIALSLSKQIKERRYFSTQDRNAIFLAGRHFMNSKEPDWQVIIDANGKKENIKNGNKPFVRTFNFTNLNAIQSIKNDSDRTLFASMDIIGYPKSAPIPVSNNVTIARSYYTLDGKKTTLSELKSGDLIIVTLNVATNFERLPDALVVDLLPAGLELENQNLGHSSVNLNDTEALNTNRELSDAIARTTIIHQEFRDDRYVAAIDVGRYNPATLVYLARAVSPGVYTVPPPYVESMYSPEFFAIGESTSKFTVK